MANEKKNNNKEACARTLRALGKENNKDALSITSRIQLASLLARKKEN